MRMNEVRSSRSVNRNDLPEIHKPDNDTRSLESLIDCVRICDVQGSFVASVTRMAALWYVVWSAAQANKLTQLCRSFTSVICDNPVDLSSFR
jgi:hypothetical protein